MLVVMLSVMCLFLDCDRSVVWVDPYYSVCVCGLTVASGQFATLVV
jgi:hypothetical protein